LTVAVVGVVVVVAVVVAVVVVVEGAWRINEGGVGKGDVDEDEGAWSEIAETLPRIHFLWAFCDVELIQMQRITRIKQDWIVIGAVEKAFEGWFGVVGWIKRRVVGQGDGQSAAGALKRLMSLGNVLVVGRVH
jgi:hypothetical protein